MVCIYTIQQVFVVRDHELVYFIVGSLKYKLRCQIEFWNDVDCQLRIRQKKVEFLMRWKENSFYQWENLNTFFACWSMAATDIEVIRSNK